MATQRKTETDSCIMCRRANCAKCNLNTEYFNGFEANDQTTALYHDGIIDDEYLRQTHLATMTSRCRKHD